MAPRKTSTTSEAPAAPELSLERLFARLEAKVDGGLERLGGRKDREPIRELHIELTHRCNLRCVMCHHWETPFKEPGSLKRELSLEDIRRIADGSKLLDGVRMVVLTGGEPLLRPDSIGVAKYLSERFPAASVGLLTNLWDEKLLRRRLEEARRAGLARLWLGSSLDGLDGVHDEVRGRDGAFEGLVETMAMLRRDFPEVGFSFSFTVTPRNYKDLWKTYRWVADQGLWFGGQMVVNHQGFEAPETYAWAPEQLADVRAQIDLILLDLCRRERAFERLEKDEAGSLGLWTRLLYWWYLRRYAERPARFFRDCMAGQRFAMLDPEGKLFFCPVNKHRTVGDARASGLDAAWTSPKAGEERAYVDSCQCDCWLNCIANPILDRALALGHDKPRGG